jgi:hypothetical protein
VSDPDEFDVLLKQRFVREHRHVAADPFVATTMQRIRTGRRRMARVRTALHAAALESSLNWAAGLSVAWVLGALAVAAVLISRVRSR